MRRLFGALLLLAGAFSLYLFTARAMFHGRDALGEVLDLHLPFVILGRDYPTDAILMLGALWGFLLGIFFVVTDSGKGSRLAWIMLFNALLLLSSLLVAAIGAVAGKDATVVAFFAIMAMGQVAIGAIILILSFFERPKGILPLFLGATVYLFGVVVGLLAFLWEG
jgi:hypothetical protein